MTKHEHVIIVQILGVVGVIRYNLAKEFVSSLSKKRAEANAVGDKVKDGSFKLMINGHYGWTARSSKTYKNCKFIVNKQKCLRKSLQTKIEAVNYLKENGIFEIETCLPASLTTLLDVHDVEQVCIDLSDKRIRRDGIDSYSSIYKHLILTEIFHFDTKSVYSPDKTINEFEAMSIALRNEKINEAFCLITTKRNVLNDSLRLVACGILGHAKKSVTVFASVIKRALLKESIFCQLVATDTDSLFFSIYGDHCEDFDIKVKNVLANDKDFESMMDYSNYP